MTDPIRTAYEAHRRRKLGVPDAPAPADTDAETHGSADGGALLGGFARQPRAGMDEAMRKAVAELRGGAREVHVHVDADRITTT